MADSIPTPSEIPKEVEAANKAADRVIENLIATNFPDTFTDAGFDRFKAGMRKIYADHSTVKVGQVLLKLDLVENFEELLQPDLTKWLGVLYNFVTEELPDNQAGLHLEPTLRFTPGPTTQVEDYEVLRGVPVQTIPCNDIAWDRFGLVRDQPMPDTMN